MSIGVLNTRDERNLMACKRYNKDGKLDVVMLQFERQTNTNGVTIVIKNLIIGSVVQFIPYSGRVTLLQMKTNYRTFNLIQVYSPTADKDENEIEEFSRTKSLKSSTSPKEEKLT